MVSAARILVVEDRPAEREALARMLRHERFDVVTAENPQRAMEHIDEPFDMIISDLRMGSLSGLDLCRRWSAQQPDTPFIIMTAYGDIDTAVSAMKMGVDEFLTKPVDPTQLLDLIHKHIDEHAEAAHSNGSSAATTEARDPSRAGNGASHDAFANPMFSSSRGQTSAPHSLGAERRLPRLIGVSETMREVCQRAEKAAESDCTVLIRGESGTGKKLVARSIHARSNRHDGPFVVVNMTALDEAVVEAELFGHAMGVVAGPTTDRDGRFAAAAGGTVFIDEVGNIPPAAQANLLRALESGVVMPVGSNLEVSVGARLIAATSCDLRQLVAEGRFREDLFYYLNVVVIDVPPLRQRVEDIEELAEHMVQELCEALGRPAMRLDDDLLVYFESHSWPGNVRQLRNCLESMVVLSSDCALTLADIPPSLHETFSDGLHGASNTAEQRSTLRLMQRRAIEQALGKAGGNRAKAARSLGISVRTLQRRMKAWRSDNTQRDSRADESGM